MVKWSLTCVFLRRTLVDMEMRDYIEQQPRGELMRLVRVSGLSLPTIAAIAKRGHRLRDVLLARRLSAATGGSVSVDELLIPEDYE